MELNLAKRMGKPRVSVQKGLIFTLNICSWDFSDGPVGKTSPSNAGIVDLIAG